MIAPKAARRSVPPFPAPRRRAIVAALAALLLPGWAGCAAPVPAAERDAIEGRWLSLEVVERDGERALRVWPHRGDSWVAGAPGTRYALRLTNRSGERLLAVVSVDGVNIVSGETARVSQRGYVLAPWQSALLTGWRKSESEVAAFEFTRLPQSYAALTGRPADVGVIGVAVFREAPQLAATEAQGAAEDRAKAGSSAAPQPAASPPPSDERLGTGHGPREPSWATRVPFERASTVPEERLQVRYDGLDQLLAAGIVPRSYATAAQRRPRAFPGDGDAAGFVPDPPAR